MAPAIASRFHRVILAVLSVALTFQAGAVRAADDGHWVHSGLIARGLPSETPFYIRDTNMEGPTVLIVGGMHGNEPAGAEAAEHIRHWPITRGRLVVAWQRHAVGRRTGRSRAGAWSLSPAPTRRRWRPTRATFPASRAEKAT